MTLPDPPREVRNIQVEAALRRVGDRLEVEYAVSNRGDEAVWVLDDMLQFGEDSYLREPRLLIVLDADDEPGLVRLVRGVVHPRATVMAPLVSAARRLEPGGRLVGVADAALPLMNSHPQEPRVPLVGTPARAVLEVGVMSGDVALDSRELEDGGRAFVPRWGTALWHQKLVRSAPMDLPP